MTPAKPSAPSSVVAPIDPDSIAPLRLPVITETTLDNGLSVVVAQRTDLPLVAVRLVLFTGAARDPSGQQGLAAFTGGLLRRGTTTRTADQIDDAVESVGGLMGVDVGYEASTLAATVPSEHVGTALEVLSDLARNPSFPQAEVDMARRRTMAQLRHQLDDPSTVADRALVEHFYGPSHPFGHPVDGGTASVGTFTRDDAVAFHKSAYSPRAAMLIFVGDIAPDTANMLAEKSLGRWEGAPIEPLEVPPPMSPDGVEILLVDKPDATQVQVRAVVPGIARNDPGYHAAVVANTVVGGGFTSRLVDEIRVNRGLSYSVGTRVVALRETGAISFSSFTKTESVRELLDIAFGVMDGFRASGPTEDELESAKRYVAGLYPGRVESIDQLAEALGNARVMGLPFDAIASYRKEIAQVRLPDAMKAARLYPSAQGSKVVLVGEAAKIAPQLQGLGQVTVIDASRVE